MINKIFDDSVLRKRFFILISIIVIINALSLVCWYSFKIKPVFIKNNEIRRKIEVSELKVEYSSVLDLEKDLERISKEYDAKFRVIDSSNEEIIVIDVKNAEFFLFSDVVVVNDDVYILNAYLHNKLSVTSMAVSLIIFQVVIILLLMISIFYATGRTIINPIQKIVDDIRDYKFGKKPIKNEINTELDFIQNEFANLVDSLEEEKREQNRIIASISHDIKTPLTSIIGYSSLMEDNDLSIDEIKKYSVKINEKANHIKNILTTFDDYLVNYDNKKLKLVDVMLKDVVKDLEADYKVELETKSVLFSVNCNCSNDVIKVDVLKLKRIFSNIISNSLRYIPKDNGIINVNITSNDKYVLFVVSDNGRGVPESILDKLFDPFFTTDSSRKISGLGLSICREFVEMHNGYIKVKNSNGFVVEFGIPISYRKSRSKKKKNN